MEDDKVCDTCYLPLEDCECSQKGIGHDDDNELGFALDDDDDTEEDLVDDDEM
jgi:hypothetical protein